MPSKTVSFSDDTYVEVIELQPEDMGFSEWIETLTKKGLNNIEDVDAVDVQNAN